VTPDAPPRVSVLVPVVERHDDLRALHAAIAEAVAPLGKDPEFLYLLSSEFEAAFRQAMELRAAEPSRVRVIRCAQPVSEATALGVGFERARGDRLFTHPAYFDADPGCLRALAEALDGGADLAFASRTARRQGALKRLQSVGFNRLASWATQTRFRDLASATRALRREVLAEVPLYGDFHRFLPVLAQRMGFVVREVPAPQDARACAPSFYRPRTYLYRALDILSVFFLTHFTRRPLRLFGAVGTLFGGLGALILLELGFERIVLEEAIAGRPVLVLGTLLVGLGVQAFTIGLLGELLLFFHAREIRDYRVAEVYEAEVPPLPPRGPG
jgi:hypothetical protein